MWDAKTKFVYLKGAHRAVHALCEKEAILGPIFLMAKVTAATTMFPYTELVRFFLSPKTQIMS